MDLLTTYNETDLKKAADEKLKITSDYLSNIDEYLNNVKQNILIDDNTIISIIAALNAGFNLILYGPPGTAKTTLSSYLPVLFYGAKCNVHTADSEWNVRKVIGGVTVTYDNTKTPPEELIGPKDGYIVEDIMECYGSVLKTEKYDTVFTVIDEFNRTNMDECLGPMFTSMGSENKTLKLDYNKGFNDDFLEVQVPNSYRIICNMNKYDRTFTNELSEALSRRFKWIYVGAPNQSHFVNEEELVEKYVFEANSFTAPKSPIKVENIEELERSDFFSEEISRPIYETINELRQDIEIGTSYKIDALKIASRFFELKMACLAWNDFDEVDKESVLSSNNINEAVGQINDQDLKERLSAELGQIVLDSIDAALVMTVIPTCESLEDIEEINRVRGCLSNYKRCIEELDRMKLSF